MKSRGDSGVDLTQVIDDKITIVGTNPNVFPSCRKDGTGREIKTISASSSQGIIEAPSAYTECEAIDNSGDHHGGNYTIIAMNKFTLDAGGGGISLSSGGNINLMAAGGLLNLVAPENISTISNVVKIVSTEITIFRGPQLYIDSDNILFASTAKFAKNLIVQGGAFINGELYINHMTAPHQVMDTSMSNILPVYFNTPTVLTGIVNSTCMNPVLSLLGGLVTPVQSTNYVQFTLDPMTTTVAQGKVLPHKHTYRHAAWSPVEGSSAVWAEAEALNKNEAFSAKKIENFGAPMDKILDKAKKRFTNSFTDLMTSLMSGIFS